MRYTWYDVSRGGQRRGATLQAEDSLERVVVLALVEQDRGGAGGMRPCAATTARPEPT